MRSLIIESSTEHGLLALIDEGKILYQTLASFSNTPSKMLIPELDKALKSTGLHLEDFSFIAVGIGPGSYTGIRLAAITAKALAFATGLPLIGVNTLKAFTPPQAGHFATAIDAKIGGAYLIIGERLPNGTIYHTEPALLPLKDAFEKLRDCNVILSPNAKRLSLEMAAFDLTIKLNWMEMQPDPLHLYQLALHDWKNGSYSSEGKLELAYLRKTQAEIEKEKQSAVGNS